MKFVNFFMLFCTEQKINILNLQILKQYFPSAICKFNFDKIFFYW